MVVRIFRHFLPLPLVLLALFEAAFSYFSVYLAAWLRARQVVDDSALDLGLLWPQALLLTSVMFVSLVATGLYSSRQRPRLLGLMTRLGVAVVGAVLVCGAVFYIAPELQSDRRILLLAAVLTFAFFLTSRLIIEHVVDEGLFKRRIVVYGAGYRAATIAQLRRRADRRGFVLVGYINAEAERKNGVPAELCLSANEGLLPLCTRLGVDEIVVAMDDRRGRFPMHELLECRLDGIEVTELVAFFERETGKLRLDMMNPSWMIFAPGFRRGRINSVLERGFDLLASTILLVIAAPVGLLTMLAIKIEDGWRASIFYGQTRVGQYGRDFRLLKFRSMREDAERDGKARWAVKNDSRATRVGAFIRLTRIDEIPQIFNVFRGEMSFVGPRPERPQFVDELNEKIPYYRERHAVKPGITGWAQLCYPYGSSEQDAVEKLQYDLYYVKNHSLIFYLAILLQTVEVIVWRKGAR